MSGTPSLRRKGNSGVFADWLTRDLFAPFLGDPVAVVASSGLPESLRAIVTRVVRSTRLWRRERSEVARELVSHFAEGLDAGRSADELESDFGDLASAARLIRRAKLRSRHWSWHTWRRACQAVALALIACTAAWCAFAVPYFSRAPSIVRNFAAEFNASIAAGPGERVAWPEYLTALREVASEQMELSARRLPDGMASWDCRSPRDDGWDETRAFLVRHAEAVKSIRRGASIPTMGCAVSNAVDPGLLEVIKLRTPSSATLFATAATEENPMLVGVLLPQLGELRMMARLLSADLHRAVEDEDAADAGANLSAMIGLATHATQSQFLIGDMVGHAILALTMERLLETLADHPGLLSDDNLRDLAHCLASFAGGGRLALRLEGERAMFLDVLQRLYSDDGRGDGRPTHSGMWNVMWSMASDGSAIGPFGPSRDSAVGIVVGPVVAAVSASRREMLREYDRYAGIAQRQHATPRWLRTSRAVDDAIDDATVSLSYRVRYGLLLTVFPQLDRTTEAIDQVEQRRDATLAAIALELHHRRHGSYPSSLDELQPGLLPTMPVDRFDGKPLRYLLREGRPVLYSIGADRFDNAGTPPETGREDAARQWQPATPRPLRDGPGAGKLPSPPPSGDWVLYPPAKGPPAKRVPESNMDG
ncbi:MAG: hypothetical protein JNM07_00740 [Phycisphaerae bacterium]|nr:hypothetical protein [Phycisphaerae bacterium]